MNVHIVVCVKMVPDTTMVRIDPTTNTLVREGVPFITNPFDNHAIEEALRIKDRYGAYVTVISMGPPAAESVIRRAAAAGADAGVLLSDRAFGGADTLATSLVLSTAVTELSKGIPVDLVFCGKQTIDGDTGQIGPGMATRLGYSQLTLVDRILSLDPEKRRITVRRNLGERHETVETTLPALLSVTREINRLRYPSVAGRLNSEELAVPVWNNYLLNLDPKLIGLRGSPTQVRRIFAPVTEKGELISGEGEAREQAVQSILSKLGDWKILED